MTEWKEYTSSDEQIDEMCNAIHGYILRLSDGTMTELSIGGPYRDSGFDTYKRLRITNYLICNPHPLADMICQQARTGQTVWWRSIEGGATGLCYKFMPPFAHPDTFEYSFTEFKEEV